MKVGKNRMVGVDNIVYGLKVPDKLFGFFTGKNRNVAGTDTGDEGALALTVLL